MTARCARKIVKLRQPVEVVGSDRSGYRRPRRGPGLRDLVFTGVNAPAPGAEVFADGFAISPGGAANRAVAAARLGAHTALVTELGDDPIGCIVDAKSARRGQPRPALRRPARGLPDSGLRRDHRRPRPLVRHLRALRRTTGLARGPRRSASPTSASAAVRFLPTAARLRAKGTTIVGGRRMGPLGAVVGSPPRPSRRRRHPDRQRDRGARSTPGRARWTPRWTSLPELVGLAVVTLGPRGALAARGSAPAAGACDRGARGRPHRRR